MVLLINDLGEEPKDLDSRLIHSGMTDGIDIRHKIYCVEVFILAWCRNAAWRSIKRLEILKKAEEYLVRDPWNLGKPLKGNFKGFFRYRMGKFRIIYTIQEDRLLILVLKVGKRDEVYDE